jgi:glycosyltransferase involved in cell wall biosynthesis
MAAPPLVSIVTPSFNQGRFLRRTIDSALNQTYPHLEYLVVDGGSTDDSVAILESYGDQFWWVSEPDAGQADAINKGLSRCRGQVLAYLNSDDVLLPTAVEKVIAYFQRYPDWDLVYGRAYLIDEQDRVTGAYRTAPFSRRRLAEESCMCQPATFWRASLTQRLGLFNANLRYCMDYDYWLRAARAGATLAHVEDVLACSRLYPETKTLSGKVPMYLESMAVCRAHVGRVGLEPFVGLWQHRCRERWQGWAGKFGRLPGVVSMLARLHHVWWRCRWPSTRLPLRSITPPLA